MIYVGCILYIMVAIITSALIAKKEQVSFENCECTERVSLVVSGLAWPVLLLVLVADRVLWVAITLVVRFL